MRTSVRGEVASFHLVAGMRVEVCEFDPQNPWCCFLMEAPHSGSLDAYTWITRATTSPGLPHSRTQFPCQVPLIQRFQFQIGGEHTHLFRSKRKTFFKCQRNRVGAPHFDVNSPPFVLFLFVFISIVNSTRLYGQLKTEQMVIKSNVVLSVTLKKYLSFLNALVLVGLIFLFTDT